MISSEVLAFCDALDSSGATSDCLDCCLQPFLVIELLVAYQKLPGAPQTVQLGTVFEVRGEHFGERRMMPRSPKVSAYVVQGDAHLAIASCESRASFGQAVHLAAIYSISTNQALTLRL